MAYQVTALGMSVLGLLRDRPVHGYEMFQTLAARHGDHVPKVRPGSLYHLVYRLTDEKLIRRAGTCRNGNRPERTTYELTDAGVAAVTERVRELVAHPAGEIDKFASALAEVHRLAPATTAEALRHRIRVLKRSAGELRALGATPGGHPVALDYLLSTTAALIDWLRRFVDTLRPGDEVGR
ncbi:MAG: PadR family transcriptional regulator [Mycolicibacterium sp.]|nr:PadR family transcriptional regulator [Mycolicibacterium sp.]